jgi:hypothetical protein
LGEGTGKSQAKETMRITLLNGNPDPKYTAFDRYLDKLTAALATHNVEVCYLMLRDLNIQYCTGCWGCWVKTPGECVAKDDTAIVRREALRSDLLLFASPVRMGFTTALLKKAVDKLIPMILPYFSLAQGEFHHLKRYPRYPRHGLLLEKSEGADDEDVAIIRACYQRLALNLKTEFAGLNFTDQSPEEVAHAFNHF